MSDWVNALSVLALAIGLATTVSVARDVYLSNRRARSRIHEDKAPEQAPTDIGLQDSRLDDLAKRLQNLEELQNVQTQTGTQDSRLDDLAKVLELAAIVASRGSPEIGSLANLGGSTTAFRSFHPPLIAPSSDVRLVNLPKHVRHGFQGLIASDISTHPSDWVNQYGRGWTGAATAEFKVSRGAPAGFARGRIGQLGDSERPRLVQEFGDGLIIVYGEAIVLSKIPRVEPPSAVELLTWPIGSEALIIDSVNLRFIGAVKALLRDIEL